MKRIAFLTVFCAVSLALSPQELQHEAVAINVEVPVRVFKGDLFVDNLTIKDFELYEDSILQRIEAVYLVKKTEIKREETEMKKEEARKRFSPEVSRNFVMMFEITDYFPQIKEALDYFFKNIITPVDTLVVVTPVKTYRFNRKSFEVASKEEIADQLNNKLRKDIILGSRDYKKLI